MLRITRNNRIVRFFRWLIPLTLTVILFFLLGHKSLAPQFFSCYSENYFLFLLGGGTLTAISYWIAASTDRHYRFFTRILKSPIFTLLIVTFGLIVILDLFFDLDNVIALFPLFLAIFIWLLSTKNTAESANKLILLITSLVVGFIIAEFSFRVLILKPKVPAGEKDFIDLVSSSWPSDVPREKKPGIFRILGLSDSFGRVGGLENYHYFLEKNLKEQGLEVEIVNFSVGEYDLYDELKILERFGAHYKPDLVLHGFVIGNDFAVSQGELMTFRNVSVRTLGGLSAYRPRNFLLVNWLRRFLIVLKDKNARQEELNRGKPSGTFSEEEFLQIEWRRMENCQIGLPSEEKWQATVQSLNKIQEKVEQMGAKYVMVLHPDQFQVENKLRERIKQKYTLDLSHYDFELPQRFLTDYCNLRKISCLDLLPIFREKGSAGGLYLFRDTHYNKNGNELATKTITNFLNEQNLITSQTDED